MPNPDLTRIPAARVPIVEGQGTASREWYRFFFNLFQNLGGGQANSDASSGYGADLAPAYTPQLDAKRHGNFYDTTTQTAAVINTAYPITFNSTSISVGVYLGSPTSRVYVDRLGTYNFQFSIQLNKSSSNAKSVYIWYRVNGVDAAYSATVVTLSGNGAASVAAWNFVVEMNAGDYFELVWSTDDTGCIIQSNTSVAPAPAIPSVILTVTDNIN
jgi:hypothetical protein